jgi:hypothetical protein
MRVLIHIGPQKTGTTYLQTRLFRLRKRLARDGIVWHLCTSADLGRKGKPRPRVGKTSDLLDILADGRTEGFAQEVAQLRAAGTRCLVISAEGLSKLQPPKFAPLREILAPDQVEIYIYLRRWSERLPSSWWQQVAGGLSTPFADWLQAKIDDARRDPIVNQSILWRRWGKMFGRETVNILSYDAMRAAKMDLADDFLRNRIGWQGKMELRSEPPREAHVRPTPLKVEAIRALNALAQEQGVQLTSRQRHHMYDSLDDAMMRRVAAVTEGEVTQLELDDAGPLFAIAREKMAPWKDRLATKSLFPDLIDPKVAHYPVMPASALQGPRARTLLGKILAAAAASPATAPPRPPRPAEPERRHIASKPHRPPTP